MKCDVIFLQKDQYVLKLTPENMGDESVLKKMGKLNFLSKKYYYDKCRRRRIEYAKVVV